MLKKLLSVAIVLIAIGTTGTVAYTAGGDDTTKGPGINVEVEQQKELEIVGPEDKLATTDNIILLSGKGKQGTNVIIEVYSTANIANDAFTLDNLPKEDEYILLLTESLEIGPLGSFAKELELKKGLYRISFSIKKDGSIEKIANRYIYVKDIEQVKEALKSVTEMKVMDTAVKQSTGN